MSNESSQPDLPAAADREYDSALEALKEHRIIEITPIEGGFEVREGCARHFSVSLTPEQLRGLGEEIMALADSAEVARQAAGKAVAGAAAERRVVHARDEGKDHHDFAGNLADADDGGISGASCSPGQDGAGDAAGSEQEIEALDQAVARGAAGSLVCDTAVG